MGHLLVIAAKGPGSPAAQDAPVWCACVQGCADCRERQNKHQLTVVSSSNHRKPALLPYAIQYEYHVSQGAAGQDTQCLPVALSCPSLERPTHPSPSSPGPVDGRLHQEAAAQSAPPEPSADLAPDHALAQPLPIAASFRPRAFTQQSPGIQVPAQAVLTAHPL